MERCSELFDGGYCFASPIWIGGGAGGLLLERRNLFIDFLERPAVGFELESCFLVQHVVQFGGAHEVRATHDICGVAGEARELDGGA